MELIEQNSPHLDMYLCNSIEEACTWAKHHINANAILGNSGKAVVFDIDDTLLFTNDQPNKPVVDLYKSIPSHVKRVVVTARPMRSQSFSVEQVNQLDATMCDHMYHMPDEFLRRGNIHAYKKKCRDRVMQNQDLLLNIGDQWTDTFGSNRVVANAHELQETGHLKSTDTYLILPKTPQGVRFLRANAAIKLPG